MQNVVALVRGLLPQLTAYTVVSAVALSVDLIAYKVLLSTGARPVAVGILAYCLGGLVHYMLSTRFVFDVSLAAKTASRRIVEFWVSGVAGLIVTASIIWIGTEVVHMPAMLSKLAAVGFSFVTLFIVRRQIVFATQSQI